MWKSTTILSTLYLRFASAQWAFADPDGTLGDYAPANDVIQGDVQGIRWVVGTANQPQVDGKNVLDDDGFASLWVRATMPVYAKLLSPSINSTEGGIFAWEVDISDSDINLAKGQFIYHLRRPVASADAEYDWETANFTLASIPFTILKQSAVAAASSSSVVSASPTTLTNATSTPTDALSEPTTTVREASADNSLSAGAIAGVAIGAIAAVALAVIAGLLFRRRSQRQRNESNGLASEDQTQVVPQSPTAMTYTHTTQDHTQSPHAMEASEVWAKTGHVTQTTQEREMSDENTLRELSNEGAVGELPNNEVYFKKGR